MRRCPRCGHYVKGDKDECEKCGYKVQDKRRYRKSYAERNPF